MERSRNETNVGTIGWATLAAGVIAWDLYAEESLTHAFERARENPRTRMLALGALAITAAHLLDVLPHRPVEFDPYYIAAKASKLII